MMSLRNRQAHPSDEELLLVADRECSPRRAIKIRENLAQCASCHNRMAELESALTSFIALHERTVSSMPHASDGMRHSLKAQLAAQDIRSRTETASRSSHPIAWSRQFAGACMAMLIVAGSFWLMRNIVLRQPPSEELASALPKRKLTPGAVRAVHLDELCRNSDLSDDPPVNISIEDQVLEEYGVSVAARHGYQLDYLITPELGGSDDIHNLWPEPYSSTSWNAHVKDALEDHLHDMVCQGKLPLATAQEEIATDWIAAYKHEFNTETPLTNAATLASPSRHEALQLPRESATINIPVL